VPVDAYRPTFVKSLVMVPIRTIAPVGAIGTYWARHHRASPEEIQLLRALADSTSTALENVELYSTLERRVTERTAELAASRAELARKNEALLRAQRQKEETAALLVHDLKSPASGILMSASLNLRKPGLAPAERRHWRAVSASAEAIARMALNLLDVTRAEDGALVVRPEDVDPYALLREIGGLMEALAEGRGQAVSGRVESRRPLRADVEILRRVLQNLVDNALRHSDTGGTVEIVVTDGPEGFVDVRVTDTGPGIPAELRERIFDKYAQLGDGAAPPASGGRGLGLTFCRLAIEAHRGRIWVEENTPHGSVFVIRLPAG
jgi:signal transduction histidine kinase